DPFIIPPDTIFNDDNTFKVLTPAEKEEYATYRFQGYKIYQVKDNAVSVSDLEDPDLARLVFQCDVKDEVSRIINFPIDEDLGISVPKLMVDGANEGITKAIKITQDQFADGDNRLVNHKSYYFIAVAYAYNNYEAYDPNNPNPEAQLRPYLGSRKSATGPILIASGIPHRVETENGGTVLNAQFGDEVPVTRIEGTGN